MDRTWSRDSIPGWRGATPATVAVGANCLSWHGGGGGEGREGVCQWTANPTLSHVAGQWRVWTVNVSLGIRFSLSSTPSVS